MSVHLVFDDTVQNFVATDDDDIVYLLGGNDIAFGGSGDDLLDGGSGNDRLRGDAGDDRVYGGSGNDRLLGGADDDALNGGSGDDQLTGGTGNDVLNGGSGIDTASYADASAAVTVDLEQGRTSGAAGTDILKSIERVDGTAFNDTIKGGDLADLLFGDDGDDTLQGGSGEDRLDGGAGSDTASYASAQSGVRVSLAIARSQDTRGAGEHLLVSIENLAGSFSDDVLTGDGGANTLMGGGGKNRLDGRAGADRLISGGTDHLTGGLDADTFVIGGGHATIADFSHAEGDRIDVSMFDAGPAVAGDQAFAFIGAAAFSHTAGELRAEVIGSTTRVRADLNGDGKGDFSIGLYGTLTLQAGDFIL
jgi:Ca2+-binding RTX toxin-like protein